VVGMAPPMCGIHPGQARLPNHQEILTVLRVRGDRPVIGAGDDDRPIQDQDCIVRPGMLRIERDRNPRRHQACDGRDGGMMRLRVRIEEDVDLDAASVGVRLRPASPVNAGHRAFRDPSNRGHCPRGTDASGVGECPRACTNSGGVGPV
jgi:hypothetical protein